MGTFSHWVVVCLPTSVKGVKKGVPSEGIVPAASMLTEGEAELNAGARQGKNDFKEIGYGGPKPPPGKLHRYYFKLYALDTHLDLKPGATRQQVLAAMNGHILGQGQLMGTYGRSGK